ncbi:hypothetical protein C1645_827526 [Glomus cerebriforme]|uniref:Uncharacterized protein n=1 Tax=Glomus cerebriforme TaxID=658196 RepID=A0A397SNE9_9GLOM|nr:hypothetical protein C1645_827526 [Glomus cerebriforme]
MKDYFTDVKQGIIHSINVMEFNSDINDFINTIKKLIARGEPNKTYLKCLEIHTLVEPNSDKYKISKVYGDLYTETDIVVKAVGYIDDGLVLDFTFSEKYTEGKNLAKWEFSQKITPTKIVSDRCRSNQGSAI